ncbi:hypothetical protein ACMFMG_009174 [Clarireedia jacksonii]
MTFRGVVYTEAQIEAYLSRIRFPPSVDRPTPENVTSQYGLDYLRRLQKYQMQACAFENLNLHYAKVIVKSLAPKDLYEKLVVRKWGGTCTESNTFFGIVLRSLGYRIRPVGARVHKSLTGDSSGGYCGWNHCVSLVTIDTKKYLVDVAMGPTTPSQPLLLEDGFSASGIGLTTCRLRWDTIPDYTDPDSKLWIYEQDNDGKSDFSPTYCFSELEFLPTDYEVMKGGTTFNRNSWFTWRIVVTRTVLDDSENVVGTVILVNNFLKRRIKGKTEHIATFTCEAERVEALKEWFGIELTEDELCGIKGMVTDLGDKTISDSSWRA